MTRRCHACGRKIDLERFAFDRRFACACGVMLEVDEVYGRRRPPARSRSEELTRRADALTFQLLYGDLPAIDAALAIERLRAFVARHLPERALLFEMVWVARWERLRAQGWVRDAGGMGGDGPVS